MKISIVGSGSYGTAFASILCAYPEHSVTLFSRSSSQVEQINLSARNSQYLDNFPLSTRLRATQEVEEIEKSDMVFLALPSSAIQPFVQQNKALLSTAGAIINLAKGFISAEKATVPEYLHAQLGSAMGIGSLKGPTFAADMLHSPISAVSISANNSSTLSALKLVLARSNVKFDVISKMETLEFLSILKNVYAIAIGIVEAKFKSPNVRAALFTDCAIEMQEVCSRCVDENVNILKYAGLGDLLLTSLNDQSRNRTLGLMIGKGFIDATAYDKAVVVEGLRSIEYIAAKLTEEQRSRAHILDSLSKLIGGSLNTGAFIATVLHRPDPESNLKL